VIALQLGPKELLDPESHVPPALVSRWFSGLRLRLSGEDVRLRGES
jgi:hypothetical protein